MGVVIDISASYDGNVYCVFCSDATPWCQPKGKVYQLANIFMYPTYTDVIYISMLDVTDQAYVTVAMNTSYNDYVAVDYVLATNYMLVYSYGVCDGKLSSSFINITSSMDFSVVCSSSNGYYYQSPNVWYETPSNCAGMQPNQLLHECAAVQQSLTALISDTCQQSITSLCKAQYNLNPPFSCTRTVGAYPMVILANSFASSNVVWGILSLIFVFMFTVMHCQSTQPTNEVYKSELKVNTIHNDIHMVAAAGGRQQRHPNDNSMDSQC